MNPNQEENRIWAVLLKKLYIYYYNTTLTSTVTNVRNNILFELPCKNVMFGALRRR